MLDKVTKETFLPLVEQTFVLDLDGNGSVPLQLTTVVSHPEPPGSQRVAAPGTTLRQEGFSLTFRGPRRPALPQRMYRLDHETLGTIDALFLVPIGENEYGRTYEAIFN